MRGCWERDKLLEKYRNSRNSSSGEDRTKIYKLYSDAFDKQQDFSNEVSKEFSKTIGLEYKRVLTDLGVEFNSENDVETLLGDNNTFRTKTDDFKKNMTEALTFMPKGWVTEVDFPITENRTVSAGYVTPARVKRVYDGNIMRMVTANNKSIMLHEFGHVAENENRYLGRLQKNFLKKSRDMKRAMNYSGKQKYFCNNLLDRYSGVYYTGQSKLRDGIGGNNYEVLTTGFQGLFYGLSGGFSPGKDARASGHRNFVLGLLVSSKKND